MSDDQESVTAEASEDELPDDLLGGDAEAEETDTEDPTDVDPEKPVSIYALYEMDEVMEQQGIVVNLGAGGEFKVARAGATNMEYTKAVNQQGKKAGFRRIKGGGIKEKEARKRMAFIYGTTIVKSWKNVYGRDGKLLPFSQENAIRLLYDLPELLSLVMIEAGRAENFRKAYVEEAAGNS